MSNSTKENQGNKDQEVAIQQDSMVIIKTPEDFIEILNELGITLYGEMELIEVKSEIPSGSMKDYPTVFKGIFKVLTGNYKANENDVINHYKKLFTEKLEPMGWTDTSQPGTGILNFHPGTGKFSTVSVMITPSDIAANTGTQDFSISLFVK